MNKAIICSLGIVTAFAPAFASARMLDPFPVNANDNRTVYMAAVDTSLALTSARNHPIVVQQPTYGVQSAYPTQAQIAVGAQNTLPISYPAAEQVRYGAGQLLAQTVAGIGTNEAAATAVAYVQPATQAVGYAQPIINPATNRLFSSSAAGWTSNLPTQTLLPASVNAGQALLLNPQLVNLETNSSATYTNGLPSFYGAGAAQGVYTVKNSQSYDASAIYGRGLAQASGTYGNNSNQFNQAYSASGPSSGLSTGQWVTTPAGWVRVGGFAPTSGNLPWR